MNIERNRPAGDDLCDVRLIHLERVSRARSRAIPKREVERLALTYKAIGDPTRVRIVMALMDGEMCVCDLAAFLGLSDSAVSHHLRRLRALALVANRRDGKVLYYSLDDRHVAELIETGLEHVREQGWN